MMLKGETKPLVQGIIESLRPVMLAAVIAAIPSTVNLVTADVAYGQNVDHAAIMAAMMNEQKNQLNEIGRRLSGIERMMARRCK